MSWPPAIKTFTVTFGPGTSLALGTDLGMKVDFTPSASAVWAATGTPLIALVESATAVEGMEGTATLPNPDQDGFIDGNGNAVKNWTYRAAVSYTQAGRVVATASKVFTVTAADTTVDLDTLIPVTSSAGVVISIPDTWSSSVAAAEQAATDAAAAAAGKYAKPSGGIPKTDLAAAVGTSLGKADTVSDLVTSGRLSETALSDTIVAGVAPTSSLATRATARAVPGNDSWSVRVMASPPTTTLYDWATAAGTVLNPRTQYLYNDFTVVSPLNGVIETVNVSGPGNVSTNKISGNFGVQPWSIETDFYGDTWVERFRPWSNGGASLWVFVDGEAVTATPEKQTDATQVGATYSYKIKFDSVKMRRIRIFLELADHVGVWIPPTQTSLATSTRRLRIACVGDSWTEPTGATYMLTGWPWQLGRYLDAEVFVAAEGGTAYSNPGASPRAVFSDDGRTSRLVTAKPDIVLVFGSINDDNQATLQADAAAYYAKLDTLLPGIPIVVVGTQDIAGTPTAARLTNSASVKAAALAAPNVVKYVDPIAESWITGTGVKNTPTGDGNADLFMGGATGSDGSHPTQAGHDYLARKMAHVLSGVL